MANPNSPSFSPRRKWSIAFNVTLSTIAVLLILIGVNYLQLPKAEQQHADHAYDDVGDYGEPLLRQSIVATK